MTCTPGYRLGGVPGTTDSPATATALQRAKAAAAEMDIHRRAIGNLAAERRTAIAELLAAGMTQAEIARALGVTQPAIAKVLRT